MTKSFKIAGRTIRVQRTSSGLIYFFRKGAGAPAERCSRDWLETWLGIDMPKLITVEQSLSA